MTTVTEAIHAHRARGWVALMLVTAGLLMLVGRVFPIVGSGVALVLGAEILLWAVLVRSAGLLVTGGLVSGLGAGVVLASGPLQGADPDLVGAAYLLCIAGGLAVFGLLSGLVLRRPQLRVWAVAGVIGTVGAALLVGPDMVAELFAWAVPVVLIAAGLIAALLRARAR